MEPTRKAQRIYVNGRFLEQPLSGVQRYAREILSALDRQLDRPGSDRPQWCLLTTGREKDVPPLANMAVRQIRSRLSGHAWEQLALARAARDGFLVGLGGSGPVLHRRQLVVIHDASVYRNPDFFSNTYGRVHRGLGRILSRRARIGTVSQFSRAELGEVLGIEPDAIPVFHNGADHMRRLSPSDGEYRKLGLEGSPYFVVLGNLTRNKNVGIAIEALKHVPDARLVLVGNLNARIFGSAGPAIDEERVHFTGRVDDANVAGLLRHAQGLLFPSLYEGFGIPPLEAMVHECPVIASDIGSVREVCRDAALYFDPRDPAALAEAMRTLLSEPDDARRLRQSRGTARASSFSWDASARALIEFCDTELIGADDTKGIVR